MFNRSSVQVMSSVSRSVAVFAVIAVLGLLSSVGFGVRLLAGTLVAIGGNSNPTSASMLQELGGDPYPPGLPTTSGAPVGVAGQGYLDPSNPKSPYYGYTFQAVAWPSQIPFTTGWDGTTGFEDSQRQGLSNLEALLNPALQSGDPVTVAGYSSGANVVVREMRYLQSIGAPYADQLGFLLMASMNRPNGGIAQRFPGFFVPLLNIPFDGTTPTDTPYKTVDVSWQYDPISDFPNYPLNVIADLNAILAFGLEHANYFPADMDGPRAVPDSTVGNITYVTLAPAELPLLVPLKMLGAPKQLLDLLRPVLKVLVDIGYDRSINPGTPTPASLSPTLPRLLALPGQLVNAIGVGIQHALNPNWDKQTPSTGTTGPTATVAAAAKNTAAVLPQAKVAVAEVAAKDATGEPDTAIAARVDKKRGDTKRGDAGERKTSASDTAESSDADRPTSKPSTDSTSRRHATGPRRSARTDAPATDSTKTPSTSGGTHAASGKPGAADGRPGHNRGTDGHGEKVRSGRKAA